MLPHLRIATSPLPSSPLCLRCCASARAVGAQAWSRQPQGLGTVTSEWRRVTRKFRAVTSCVRALLCYLPVRVFDDGQRFSRCERCSIYEASTMSRLKIEQHLGHRVESVWIVNSGILRHILDYGSSVEVNLTTPITHDDL
jgi:hypothetical protein